MIEEVVGVEGAVIKKVTILEGDAVSGEYGAYCIEVELDIGTLRIKGCHDSGPDVTADGFEVETEQV
jgi:hypothetical protein